MADGQDPAAVRREQKLAHALAATNTFRAVASELLEKLEAEGKFATTLKKLRWLLSKLAPAIGHRPVAEISPHELLQVLKVEERAKRYETARRLRSFASRVFRFAVSTTRASTDPAQPLRGALISPVAKHHSAITDTVEFGQLVVAIDRYSGQPITRLAMLFTSHVFQRPGEVRQAEWTEIDLQEAIWTIPAERMKQRRSHRVSLSKQSVEILREVEELSGGRRYVFPKLGSWRKPMSENAVNQALRRMGYGSDRMTAHGFRSSASTMLNESGLWSYDAIERLLAHADTNQIRAAYHRGAHWDERVRKCVDQTVASANL